MQGSFLVSDSQSFSITYAFSQASEEFASPSFEGFFHIFEEKILVSQDVSSSDPLPNLRVIDRLSGSGTLNKNFLSHFTTPPTHLVSLRKEPFLMINGHSVSLFGGRNDVFGACSASEIEAIEMIWKTSLKKASFFTYSKIVEKDADGFPKKVEKVTEPLEEVMTFSEFGKKIGLKTKRFYFIDWHCPDRFELERLSNWIRETGKEERLHLFCKRGLGRTTFMLVYTQFLLFQEAFDLEKAAQEQAKLGGKELNAFPEKGHFKREEAEKRWELLKQLVSLSRRQIEEPRKGDKRGAPLVLN